MRLIGRSDEFEVGVRALVGASRSHAAAVLFEGPPGIGKTTLLDGLAARALETGFTVLRASCDEPDEHRPFSAFVELLGLGNPGADARWEILESLLLAHEPAEALDTAHSTDRREQIFDELTSAFGAMVLDAPVAVVVDDLQWSDRPTLLALDRLVRAMAGQRFALLGGHRPTESEEVGRLDATRVALPALEEDDVRELVCELSSAAPDASLLDLAARAGGNPLFVTELILALREEGAIDVADGTATASAGHLPGSVHATVRRRLGAMSRETLSMLTVAAVLGEPFALEDIAVATGEDGIAVYERLEPAVTSGFLKTAGDRFDFRHDVVREALYLELPLPARRAFHLKVARALACVGADVQRVARHYSLGAEPGDAEAADWLTRAGTELTPFGPSTAMELLQQALALVGRATARRMKILTALMTAALQAGEHEICERAAREVLSNSTDSASRMAAHNVRYGTFLLRDRYADALAEIRDALATEELDDADRAYWRSLEATAHAVVGNVAAALEAAEEALQAGRATGMHFAAGRALTVRAVAQRLLGAYSDAADIAKESMREVGPSPTLAIRNQSPSYDLFQAYSVNSPMLVEADEFDTAEEALRAATIGLAELGQLPMATGAHWALGVLLFHAGRWDEAQAEFATARGISLPAAATRVVYGDVLPELRARTDDIEGAARALDEATLALDLGLPVPGNASVAAGKAYLLEAEGRTDEAVVLLNGLLDAARAFGTVLDVRIVGVPLARLLVARGDLKAAEKLAVDADAAAARAGDVASVTAAAAHVRGLVTNDGDAFAAAIDLLRGSPRRLALAVALEDAGSRLTADRTLQIERLEEARSRYEALGALRDARRVSATLRGLGVRTGARGARTRAVSGWDSLTPSEIRVVELLSEGLTNPQIGERLYLSRKTVATHVSAALRKLGVSSRTEIAAIVARRGQGA